jgi:hypothetical protein
VLGRRRVQIYREKRKETRAVSMPVAPGRMWPKQLRGTEEKIGE